MTQPVDPRFAEALGLTQPMPMPAYTPPPDPFGPPAPPPAPPSPIQQFGAKLGAAPPPSPTAPIIPALRPYSVPGAYEAAGMQAPPPPKPAPQRPPTIPELVARTRADEQELLKSYETTKEEKAKATGAEAQMQTHQADLLAQQQRDIARMAETQAAIDKDAQQKHQAYIADTDRIAKDVSSQKIDPARLYRNANPVTSILMLIGGALGGMYQGMTRGSSNQFIDNLNRLQDHDIAAQQSDMANKRAGVEQRNTVLGQMMKAHGDQQLAAMQLKNSMMEAAKAQIDSQMAQDKSEITQASGGLALDAINKEQLKLKEDIDARAAQTAIGQANAAASAQMAARRHAEELAFKTAELGIKSTEAEAKMVEASGKVGQQANTRLMEASKAITPDMVNAINNVNQLKQAVGVPQGGSINEATKPIPGVGPLAEFREKIAGPITGQDISTAAATSFPVPAGLVGLGLQKAAASTIGLSPEERQGKMLTDRLFDSYRVMVTGAGASVQELDRLEKSFYGAKTPEEQRAMLSAAEQFANGAIRAKISGLPPEEQAVLLQRLGLQGVETAGKPMPTSVQTGSVREMQPK